MKTILVSLLLLLAVSPCLAADKIHLMRVDCSLIQGTERVWLVAEPKLSARTVTWVHCGEDVIARSSQDGWTKVLKEIGESPKWIEGYIGSSLLTEIALPDGKPTTSAGPFGASPAQPTYMSPAYRVDGSEPKPPQGTLVPDSRPSSGLGVGPKHRGGTGNGTAYRVGGSVTAPRALYAPDPEYSDEARHAKYQGTVCLWLIVGPDGKPRDIRVTKPLEYGLNEKAIEAVSRWRFEPATKDGKPVAVQINVEVNFRLY